MWLILIWLVVSNKSVCLKWCAGIITGKPIYMQDNEVLTVLTLIYVQYLTPNKRASIHSRALLPES